MSRQKSIVVVIGVALLLTTVIVITVGAWTARKDVVISLNGKSYTTEVVTTEADRSKGLSGRDKLGNHEAMLFVFDKEGYYPFWMKDMKFAIDIVWLDSDMRVVHKEVDVRPDSYPESSYVSEGEAKYVLELATGEARDLQQGTVLTIKKGEI